ncbi:MAG: thiamine diphosphokinase [Tannerella sp.]|jgi:thiamine pyrophosphokinase|nr:thiamine diphosphokinase [Tannerella sp.]
MERKMTAQAGSAPFDAVILADGCFPSHPAPLGMLERLRDRLLCCDGAADALLAAGFMPVAVVGDGDSISAQARERLAKRLVILSEQENNDLTKAVHYGVSLGYRRLCLAGATGKREDHTLGNISLLADYADVAEVEMWTDYGTLTPVAGDTAFESYPGQQVSVFCLEPFPLTLQGLRWPVTNRTLTRWWQASLNEATGRVFHVRTAGRAIVFREYPPPNPQTLESSNSFKNNKE